MRYAISDHYTAYKPKDEIYSDDEELFSEEYELVLSNLVTLTGQGKIKWRCTSSLPLDDIVHDSSAKLRLVSEFYVDTRYNQNPIRLNMQAIIDLPSGRGDLLLSAKAHRSSEDKYFTALSERHPNYYHQRIASLKERYKTDTVMQLFDLIIPTIADSPAVEKGFNIPAFCHKYADSIENNRLYQLAKILHQNHDALNFYRCVFDTLHREYLYEKFGL